MRSACGRCVGRLWQRARTASARARPGTRTAGRRAPARAGTDRSTDDPGEPGESAGARSTARRVPAAHGRSSRTAGHLIPHDDRSRAQAERPVHDPVRRVHPAVGQLHAGRVQADQRRQRRVLQERLSAARAILRRRQHHRPDDLLHAVGDRQSRLAHRERRRQHQQEPADVRVQRRLYRLQDQPGILGPGRPDADPVHPQHPAVDLDLLGARRRRRVGDLHRRDGDLDAARHRRRGQDQRGRQPLRAARHGVRGRSPG